MTTHKKILVVDDDTDLREALDTALTHAGFATYTAADGKSGVTLALKEKPDLILLDIMMPTMTGHEALAAIRKDVWGKTVPVLFLTNFEDAKNIAQGFELQGNDYLIKSNTSLEAIVTKVKQYLAGYYDHH